jgi:hypothetical protein
MAPGFHAAVCTALCNRLVERGLKIEDPILCVVDGGKGTCEGVPYRYP